MTDADWAEFFQLHDGLDRQGPGTPEDVAWALTEARPAEGAHILDAGCGAGADFPALLQHPGARITAVDTHPAFIETVRRRFRGQPVTAETVSMADAKGPFDFIWCQGALYFLGITEGLQTLAPKLGPGGTIAFSEPVWLTDAPSDAAQEFWQDYPAITNLQGLDDRISAAGLTLHARRLLAPNAWEAYYGPMEARIAELRPTADPALIRALDAGAREAANWRAGQGDFTYALSIVAP